jgi:hypothetical protein
MMPVQVFSKRLNKKTGIAGKAYAGLYEFAS